MPIFALLEQPHHNPVYRFIFRAKTDKNVIWNDWVELDRHISIFKFRQKSWATTLKRQNGDFEGSWKLGFVESHDLKIYTSVSHPERDQFVKFGPIPLDKTPLNSLDKISILTIFQILSQLYQQEAPKSPFIKNWKQNVWVGCGGDE